MEKPQNVQRETYFKRHKYERCKSTFQNAEHVIKTMRDTNAVLIDEYYDRYPFEEYAQNYIRYVLAFMRISENRAEYQECVSAGELAYMYSISRCACMMYEHVEAYIRKLVWIYIKCGLVIYHETQLICRNNHLKHIELDHESWCGRV